MSKRKPIPGYHGKYLADIEGNIYRVYKSVTRKMQPTKKKNGSLEIRLYDGKKRKAYTVHRLVIETFYGPLPDGYAIYHKNRAKSDNALWNLQLVSRRELGKMTGSQSNRKAVARVCPKSSEVEFYSSARSAAKANYMSYQTVIDRCNGKVKNPIAPDGYIYHWGDKVDLDGNL